MIVLAVVVSFAALVVTLISVLFAGGQNMSATVTAWVIAALFWLAWWIG